MPTCPASARNATSFLANARLWHKVDAKFQTLGHLATKLAMILMGKHKPIYHRSIDCGDYLVVTNAKDLVFKRIEHKEYSYHTRYAGGLKIVKAEKLFKKNPCLVLRRAVFGMLPDNNFRPLRMCRLKIFVGEENPYEENIVRCFTPETYYSRVARIEHEKAYWRSLGFDPNGVVAPIDHIIDPKVKPVDLNLNKFVLKPRK